MGEVRSAAASICLALLLVSCVGSGPRVEEAADAGELLDMTAAAGLPSISGLDEAMLALPSGARHVAASFSETVMGSEYLLTGGDALVQDDSLHILPEARNISWGIYGIESLTTALSSIQVSGDALDGGRFYLAIANYERGRWDFHRSPAAVGIYHLGNLKPTSENFISPAGNVYAAIIGWDTDNYKLDSLTFTWESNLPVPINLNASDGTSWTEISLSWEFSGEADGFSLQRAEKQGGPWSEIAQPAADSRDYVDVYNIESNDYPAGDPVFYRLAVTSGTETGFYSAPEPGHRDFGTDLLPDLRGLCSVSSTGAQIIWRGDWLLDYVELYRDNPENLISTQDILDFDVFNSTIIDTTASSEHAHLYWLRPVIGNVAGPKAGPVEASRAVWGNSTLSNSEGYAVWGEVSSCAHINGLPALAVVGRDPLPLTEDRIIYAASQSEFPLGEADFSSSVALTAVSGTLGVDIELCEFEGRPLIFYSTAAGQVRYLYADSAAPAGPPDWQSGLVSVGLGEGVGFELLDYAGQPVICMRHSVSADARICFLESVFEGGLLFGSSTIEICTNSNPQLAVVGDKVAVAYQRGTEEEFAVAVATTTELSPQMQWAINPVGELEVSDERYELGSFNGAPIIVCYPKPGSTIHMHIFSEAGGHEGTPGWLQRYFHLPTESLSGFKLISSCISSPLLAIHRPSNLCTMNIRPVSAEDNVLYFGADVEILEDSPTDARIVDAEYFGGGPSMLSIGDGPDSTALIYRKVRRLTLAPE